MNLLDLFSRSFLEIAGDVLETAEMRDASDPEGETPRPSTFSVCEPWYGEVWFGKREEEKIKPTKT